MAERGTQTIEIGCPPGNPRPKDLLPSVIEGTGLEVRDPVSMSFGDWEWDYNDIDPKKWKEIQPTLKDRLVALHNSGVVRYCSW